MRGLYKREKIVGLSKIQNDIINELKKENKPQTIMLIMRNLKIDNTWSNKTSITRSFSRLRNRGLIRSIGRTSNREHEWVIVKNA